MISKKREKNYFFFFVLLSEIMDIFEVELT